jgi:hypothetical protein
MPFGGPSVSPVHTVFFGVVRYQYTSWSDLTVGASAPDLYAAMYGAQRVRKPSCGYPVAQALEPSSEWLGWLPLFATGVSAVENSFHSSGF